MKICTRLTAILSAAAMLSMTAGATPVLAASADTKAFIGSSNRALLAASFDPVNYAESLNTLYKKNFYQTSTSYNWDGFSDVSPVDLAAASAALQAYKADPENYLYSVTADANGINITSRTAPEFGFNYTYAYDTAGNTVAINSMEIAGVTGAYEYGNPLHREQVLTYDDAGRHTATAITGSYLNSDGTVAEGYSWNEVTSYTVNAAGQAVSATDTLPDNAYQVAVSYDKYGRISKQVYTDQAGVVETYRYTYKNNRIVKASCKSSNGNSSTITYTYDSAKRPTKAVQGDSTFFFTYDAAGKLVEMTQCHPYQGPDDDLRETSPISKFYIQYNY